MSDQNKHNELNHLFWKDEILQVMYWMHGEGLGSHVSLPQLQSLLNTQDQTLSFHLDILVDEGYIVKIGDHEMDSRYQFKKIW